MHAARQLRYAALLLIIYLIFSRPY